MNTVFVDRLDATRQPAVDACVQRESRPGPTGVARCRWREYQHMPLVLAQHDEATAESREPAARRSLLRNVGQYLLCEVDVSAVEEQERQCAVQLAVQPGM